MNMSAAQERTPVLATPRGEIDGRREQTEDAIVLGLLDAVDANATVTQRGLAEELGIALGLTNTYLRRCVRKGLLKVTEIPARRYAYYLTPQGFSEKSRLTARYLAVSFDLLRRARAELTEIYAEGARRGERRFALIGAGDLADVAILVAPRCDAEIAILVPAEQTPTKLQAALAQTLFHAAIITATELPQETFAAAVDAFGRERVRAPALLRIRTHQEAADV